MFGAILIITSLVSPLIYSTGLEQMKEIAYWQTVICMVAENLITAMRNTTVLSKQLQK